jgi:hypothetical protein
LLRMQYRAPLCNGKASYGVDATVCAKAKDGTSSRAD